MAKAISLEVYSRFNDRGSISTALNESVEVDAGKISVGDVLPGWKWKSPDESAPIVKYCDGECLELFFEGRTFSVRAGGGIVELLSADCSGNPFVQEAMVIAVKISEVFVPARLPKWSEMFRKSSFNAIILNALPEIPVDRMAELWYMRALSLIQNLFFLLPETVDLLEKKAMQGNKYALFGLGRYHICTQKDPDSTEKAISCFEKAWDSSINEEDTALYEAAVALAMAWYNGDAGIVDRSRAYSLLKKSLDAGCEYAEKCLIHNIVYGFNGMSKDPLEVIRLCESYIDVDKKEIGIDNVNPVWYYYIGVANRELEGLSHGSREFRMAVDAGVIEAWSDLAIALSHDDEGTMVDKTAFLSVVRLGAARRSDICMYFLAMSEVDDFDNMSGYKQLLMSMKLRFDLEKAYEMGSFIAADTLGDIYYYGNYGVVTDDEKAFSYYAKGALLNSVYGYEKMYEMINNHYIDKSQDFTDMVALRGARLGSEMLLGKTVMAYTYGRLTEFASEIEQRYVPFFDKEDPEEDTDDEDTVYIDDDGRFDAWS